MRSLLPFSILLTAIFWFPHGTYSQSIDRVVFSAAGGYAGVAAADMSYSIGEPVVFTGVATSVILTQGFEQEDLMIYTATGPAENDIDLRVFPNPVHDQLRLRYSGDLNPAETRVDLYDLQGKKIQLAQAVLPAFSGDGVLIDLANIPAGIYLLKIYLPGRNESYEFKICKV